MATADVSAEAPVAAEPQPAAEPAPEPEPEPEDVPAGTSDVDLDEQVPGWPPGTTRREVRAASEAFFANLPRWCEPDQELDLAAESPTRWGEAAASPASPTPADVPAGTSADAHKVTDAEALLALAQDALAVEHDAHPAIARRRRAQLTAQIDPLSGWGRQADGELLPPTSLRAVTKTLPGRGGGLRLRPVTDAVLRRHDLGRTAREANTALRELLGTLDGERCRFPGCTRRKKLHAHHVLYWVDGGSTDLDNLVHRDSAPGPPRHLDPGACERYHGRYM